jgi:hypothetical protein
MFIIKGVVAAIRELGCRFLEYHTQSQKYHDIGDKRAWDKTSQTLREGLKEIWRQVYSDIAADRHQFLLGSPEVQLPVEDYFRFSLQALKSLHKINEVDAP